MFKPHRAVRIILAVAALTGTVFAQRYTESTGPTPR